MLENSNVLLISYVSISQEKKKNLRVYNNVPLFLAYMSLLQLRWPYLVLQVFRLAAQLRFRL